MRPHPLPGPPPLIWAMFAAFCAPEAAFYLAENGLAGPVDMRWRAYVNLAYFDVFFEGVLKGFEVPATFWLTPLTHAFLHGGPLHLVMNSVIFLGLGGALANGLGMARFLALFAATAVGGALTFSVITDFDGPLVGASGVLFGFFGALKRWEWRYIRRNGASSRRFWGTIAGLIALNVVLYVATLGNGGMLDGAIAWEAHLGGFIAGFLIAPLLAPNAAGPSPI